MRAAGIFGAALAALAVAGCDDRVSALRLIGGLDGEDPRGLTCVADDPPNRPLVERGLDAGVVSIVIDYLRLGGTPGCRISELLAWCETAPCEPILAARECIPVPLDDVQGIADLPDAIGAAVSGRVVSADAPQEPVMIRAIVVAQSCEDATDLSDGDPDVACEQLMGCLYTCPVTLGEATGDIVLDLDVIGNACEQQVEVCASSHGFRADDPTGWCDGG